MQRKLLAAAVVSAFAAPAAFAQSLIPPELQIYGRVNVTAERITVDNSSNTAVQPNQSNYEFVDNSSRIGFRYNKQLVPGTKAIFQIESRVNLTDASSGTFASRDSYAGLQGDAYGTIRLGRTIGPVYYATYDYISMHNHDTGNSADALLNPTIFGNAGFMNNTLWYTSPKLGGAFTVDFAFSLLAETRIDPTVEQPRYLGLVGAYDTGPLHLALSYANTKNTSAISAGTGNNDMAYTFGGSYDFKSFVLGALVEKSESDVAGGGSNDRTYWRVSGMLPVGKHEFHLNYGMAGETTTDDGAKQYTLAYNYNITKETKVYVFYTTVDNDTAGTYGFRQSTPATAGADQTSIALGFRHNF